MTKHPTKGSRCEVLRPAVPSESGVYVDLRDILVSSRGCLLDLSVRMGLKVLGAMLEEDRVRLCGPKGYPDPNRTATRYGTDEGQVVLGGRGVSIRKPRVRSVALADVPAVQPGRSSGSPGLGADGPGCEHAELPAVAGIGGEGCPGDGDREKRSESAVRSPDPEAAGSLPVPFARGRGLPDSLAGRDRHWGSTRPARNTSWVSSRVPPKTKRSAADCCRTGWTGACRWSERGWW